MFSRTVAAASLLTIACDVAHPGLGQLEKRTAELEQKVQSLTASHDTLQSQVFDLNTSVTSLTDREISIKCGVNTYSFVETDLGRMLVVCEDMKPFGDGFRLRLKIGNPHQVVLQGFRLHARYHPQWGSKPFNVQQAETGYTETLWPGTWTTISLVLSPAKPSDVSIIWLTMSVDRVSLR